MPYFENYHGNVTRIHLLLEQKRWASFVLQVQSNPGTRVFVNNKLIDVIEQEDAVLENVQLYPEVDFSQWELLQYLIGPNEYQG